VCVCVCVLHCICASIVLTANFSSLDSNSEETAVGVYWVTDAVDRCRVGFLPRHCIRQATLYDGRLVQVVAMLADSDNPRQRQFSRYNLGACHAVIIDGSPQMIESTATATTETIRNPRDGESFRSASAASYQNTLLPSYHEIASDVFAESQSDEDSDN
jgi:hypothetical protein